MAENLLTVAALRTTAEADLIRGKLVAAGIEAVLVEPERAAEGAVAGRVQVQVTQPDFERAMQLLFPIPKIKPAAKPALPPWQCPKCGEQVMGQFPACWSCGTTREGSPGAAAHPVLPAAPPRMPPPPLTPAGEASPPQVLPPRITLPAAPPAPAAPVFNPPPVPVAAGPAASRPAMNGDSATKTKAAPLPPMRIPRTAEDENLQIVVPAWDGAAGASAGQARGRKSNPTDADDRAARRAWWTAVIGIICPPVLIYSICVVLILGLTNRPLSARGHRFFYGALAVNALIIAAYFALLGTRQ